VIKSVHNLHIQLKATLSMDVARTQTQYPEAWNSCRAAMPQVIGEVRKPNVGAVKSATL
jgi:hypothetical protein